MMRLRKAVSAQDTPSRHVRDRSCFLVVGYATVISWVHSMAFIAKGQVPDAP